ncbi:hypothetical protein F4781DRAFT_282852 [Annulohypoxylon bovei var. microspora]|nr:hypothetical protein F4781DRAFT_282852 [Annulohypoxylon bovei var. microspora]
MDGLTLGRSVGASLRWYAFVLLFVMCRSNAKGWIGGGSKQIVYYRITLFVSIRALCVKPLSFSTRDSQIKWSCYGPMDSILFLFACLLQELRSRCWISRFTS